MPEVSIKIGPKTYKVSCGEGQQEQVAKLGNVIAEKYAQLGDARAPTESQNLLFAALFMADELSELRTKSENSARELKSKLSEQATKHSSALKEAEESLKAAEEGSKSAEERLEAAEGRLKSAEEATGKVKQEAAAELEAAVAKAKAEAESELEKARKEAEQEKAKSGKKSELKAEIATLRKAEEEARREIASLKEKLADTSKSASGDDELVDEKIAKTLEQLAERAETLAQTIEDASRSMLEDANGKA